MTWRKTFADVAHECGVEAAQHWAEWFGFVSFTAHCRQCDASPKRVAFLVPELCEECWYSSPRVVDRRPEQMELFK